jgi:hypothetical protein
MYVDKNNDICGPDLSCYASSYGISWDLMGSQCNFGKKCPEKRKKEHKKQ